MDSFIIAGPDVGIESSQSFANLGNRLCTVSMLTRQQIAVVLGKLQAFESRLEEINAK